MATLGPDPRPHSQLASTSIQSNISGNNVPTNRGLERALEEGANSGFFNLSARKLKEFPGTASNFDLSDTVEADLSRNRLAEVPSEVCHLVALESLNLYHNCIKTIPDTIINLQSLTSLNLSRNQLCALPACLCGLPLRVLNVSNNKLVCIPEAIGQLRSLMELDVSCNEITALPRHIGRLKALRELNVRRNLLCVLPEDLAELPLVKLDFSCNKVSTIPVSYRKMAQLQNLQLENNPLQSPPAQICMKGKVHIFKYLSIEACRSDKMPDSLYLPVMERLSLSRPATGSTEDIDQNKKQDTDSGVGSDNGDKRLSATEPSDEDSLSLNVPMSHITEEEGLSKDDSSEHISTLTADPHGDGVQLIEESPTEALKDLKEQLGYRDSSSALSNRFRSYIKGRTPDYDEPLRIEEDTHWASEQTSKVTEGTHIAMINQLKEAVELLQDPNRVSMETEDLSGVQLYPVEMVMVEDSLNGQDSDGSEEQTTPKWDTPDGGFEFQKKRELILERARLEAQLAYQQYETHMSNQGEVLGSGTTFTTPPTPPFGLKPRSAPASLPCSPQPCFRPLLTQALSVDKDTPPRPGDGVMHTSVFLRTHKSLESVDPQFTMRRKMEQLREELELMEQLRESIESRLKVALPEDLGSSLMDGVVLCHLANHIRPRSVASIHVPSSAVPKLSMAKCRRNVENFLDACRKMGVPESSLCSAYDIIQCHLRPIRVTVCALVAMETPTEGRNSDRQGEDPSPTPSPAPEVSTHVALVPSPAWQPWDLIGSSLVHVFCLLLLFVAYSWSELT
ncbi:leucine-rich repeat and calponin homology domain-containing protein 1 isoform X1 [Oncorhynchus kisutch]|uniref:leucine-rich repeat and calponin homology domain-containing protein 1 isoform X1 n=1 Tax=Oncorhynchus kisutch TaxID=8019 RepID=UPI0012DD8C8C|nr:leucine-rich repeat and calponin homology domain-containing protein 1 isoform X1 [Oncorhynchus kisutch]